ncbi:hypothetical protein KGO5_05662 [Sinorhizobium sp. KGO-5]|nr:hypothetical protein KGO5_05662 [Sinorhizobium sp. KGO-5]
MGGNLRGGKGLRVHLISTCVHRISTGQSGIPLFPLPFAIPLPPLLGSTIDGRNRFSLSFESLGSHKGLLDRETGLQHTADGGRNAHAANASSHTWIMTTHSAGRSLSQHMVKRSQRLSFLMTP